MKLEYLKVLLVGLVILLLLPRCTNSGSSASFSHDGCDFKGACRDEAMYCAGIMMFHYPVRILEGYREGKTDEGERHAQAQCRVGDKWYYLKMCNYGVCLYEEPEYVIIFPIIYSYIDFAEKMVEWSER